MAARAGRRAGRAAPPGRRHRTCRPASTRGPAGCSPGPACSTGCWRWPRTNAPGRRDQRLRGAAARRGAAPAGRRVPPRARRGLQLAPASVDAGPFRPLHVLRGAVRARPGLATPLRGLRRDQLSKSQAGRGGSAAGGCGPAGGTPGDPARARPAGVARRLYRRRRDLAGGRGAGAVRGGRPRGRRRRRAAVRHGQRPGRHAAGLRPAPGDQERGRPPAVAAERRVAGWEILYGPTELGFSLHTAAAVRFFGRSSAVRTASRPASPDRYQPRSDGRYGARAADPRRPPTWFHGPGLDALGGLMPRYGQTALLAAAAAVLAGAVTAGLFAVATRTPANGAGATPTVPGNPRVSGLTCKNVTFAWDAAGDDKGVKFYDVYHDGQLMKSVSDTHTVHRADRGPRLAVGPLRQRPRRRRQRLAGQHHGDHHAAAAPPTPRRPPRRPASPASASGTTVTLTWTAATDNVGVKRYDVYRGSRPGPAPSRHQHVVRRQRPGRRTPLSRTSWSRATRPGNVSARSNTTTFTTGAACTGPVCAVTQLATDTEYPWGLVTLPDGTHPLQPPRRARHRRARTRPTGAKKTIGTVPNVQSTDGEGGLHRPGDRADLRHRPLAVHHAHLADRQPDRPDQDGRRQRSSRAPSRCCSPASCEQVPQRRPPAVRPGRQAVRGHRRRAERRQRAEHGRPQRQGAAAQPGRHVPADNPFHNYVWSYGHRNPQGLAFDSQGRLWEQEFGNSVMDETNLIVKGGNYGWPAVRGHRPATLRDAPDTSRPSTPTRPRRAPAPASRSYGRALPGLRARYPDVPRGDQRRSADRRAAVLQRHLRPAAHGRAGHRTAACG